MNIGCIVDVETTGLSPDFDEIIEIALILFSYDKKTGEVIRQLEEITYLREPQTSSARSNYESAYQVHGIPYRDVEGKEFDDSIINDALNKSDVIIAHNASFDRSFLVRMYPSINEKKWYCSMRNIKWKDYGFANKKLLTLIRGHRISSNQSHRALDDTTQLLNLLKLKSQNGEIYLKELLSTKAMRKYQPKVKLDFHTKQAGSSFSI
ncbi:exonuclease domain-containing protein [Bacillus sp. PS06]|uniref:exonuclease domain-containing protein n=1 Tax=Bacillus sp. PS06 TaxID=2764176 RepID=UPI0017857722|nr:exonuclease domain-containing protein [Bacillus sp. PS06]MBD8067375.1 DNA polymerase III subunit epsilon [Bacillus sp. PS06]